MNTDAAFATAGPNPLYSAIRLRAARYRASVRYYGYLPWCVLRAAQDGANIRYYGCPPTGLLRGVRAVQADPQAEADLSAREINGFPPPAPYNMCSLYRRCGGRDLILPRRARAEVEAEGGVRVGVARGRIKCIRPPLPYSLNHASCVWQLIVRRLGPR
eukprot:2909610-Rhodomonas_salina.1